MLLNNGRRRSIGSFKIHNKIAFAFVCLFIATSLSFGSVFAKYAIQKSKEINVNAPEFYFESDLLSVEGSEYVLNPGTQAVQIVLKNYEDSLRYSKSEITYTVTADNGKLSASSGTLSGESSSNVIELSELKEGETYNVTVTGNMKKGGADGFKKVLKATFTVKKGEQKIFYYVDDSDDYYVYLTVWTEALSGDVNVVFPDGVLPDNTCEGMEDVLTTSKEFDYEDITLYTSHEFRFIKTSSYAGKDDFAVKLTDENNDEYTAEYKKPA